MPRHDTIEANLLDIFSKHQKLFDEMKEATRLDPYVNAFISLHEKGVDIKHFEDCFESLRQACQEALIHADKYRSPTDIVDSSKTDDTFVGGESELREELNNRLSPKTIARATLYNYLEELGIRKTLYTKKDADLVIDHMKSLRASRKKSD